MDLHVFIKQRWLLQIQLQLRSTCLLSDARTACRSRARQQCVVVSATTSGECVRTELRVCRFSAGVWLNACQQTVLLVLSVIRFSQVIGASHLAEEHCLGAQGSMSREQGLLLSSLKLVASIPVLQSRNKRCRSLVRSQMTL